ncbi:uncharacterized protein LOC124827599 [Vigna umbellata]|uniref:uncharacterized protein LOC124827599 n=1 Tax=Vigna umbellata TaxID=87088 RepID=UPI001F5F43A4|nr:uncharacterized protein LOC124827599 [Vigna umbellata]
MTEALQQILEYAKFLKKLLKRKKYLEDETIEVQGKYNVILQKAPPPKIKDPGSFTIPCTIKSHKIGKALIDLGSSINLMLLSVLEKIGGLEVQPAKMTLFMTNGSTEKPSGVVEDVMVQTDNLIFLVDFVVMEMEEDLEIHIIHGRLFMKTAKVIINVDDRTITLKDREDEVIFNVFNNEQQIQVKKTSLKAACGDALKISTKATKLDKKGKKCFLTQVKEKEKDSKGKSVHQDSLEKHEEFRPGIPVRFNKKLWVVKELRMDRLIEIESPISRRIKKVNRKLLKNYWCREEKDNTKIKDVT